MFMSVAKSMDATFLGGIFIDENRRWEWSWLREALLLSMLPTPPARML